VTEGIAPIDVAVAGHDPLWVTDVMNGVADRLAPIYVRSYESGPQALEHLTPGHPAVLVCGDPALDESVAWSAELAVDRPELAVLATNAALAAHTGRPPLDAEDRDAIIAAVGRALVEQQAAVQRADQPGEAAGPPAGRGAGAGTETGGVDDDDLILGPADTLRIIAVTSGKGGVGTTSVAINLAAALAGPDRRVALLDAHGATGDVGLLLGLPHPPRASLDTVALDDVTVGRHLTRHAATDVAVVMLPTDEDQLSSYSVRQLLEVLVALGPSCDTVVVDLPLTLLAASDLAGFVDQVLLVSTSGLASLKNARIAADAIGRDHPVVLVLNETVPDGLDVARGAIEQLLQVEIVVELPFDDTIVAGATADPATALSDPSSKYSKHIAKLATHVAPDPR